MRALIKTIQEIATIAGIPENDTRKAYKGIYTYRQEGVEEDWVDEYGNGDLKSALRLLPPGFGPSLGWNLITVAALKSPDGAPGNIEAVRESLIRKEARDARGETKHEKNATIHHENLRMGKRLPVDFGFDVPVVDTPVSVGVAGGASVVVFDFLTDAEGSEEKVVEDEAAAAGAEETIVKKDGAVVRVEEKVVEEEGAAAAGAEEIIVKKDGAVVGVGEKVDEEEAAVAGAE
ncbi:MAG: hypothetical protein ALECFALPRED_004990 [Alectoria fallacina]|uniref:Uncharacterized protein n=1 Tax=Alectoria fallacina TaxID=1903189 RepID=A0A8H3IWM9_9LECA|nr:MAG: hypothetical protein ALECFALPRED_004990 [Alectoria fallacina]